MFALAEARNDPYGPARQRIFEKVLDATCEELKVALDVDFDNDGHLELEVRRELMEIVISNGVDDIDTMRRLLLARVMDRGLASAV
jgi:hypothetical protein